MTTIEALEVALKKEETSIELYEDMLNKHRDVTELITFLLNEEYKHHKLIQEKIAEIIKY